MAGEYRTEAVLGKLPTGLAQAIRDGLRIALTDVPMYGVVAHLELSAEMAAAFEAAGEIKYAEGLRTGTMIPVHPYRKCWKPGELFFRS